jgi:hypothetical protein
MRTRAAIAVLAVTLSAGCGASDRAPDATAAAQRFQTALEARDGQAACAQLSEETASNLEQQEQAPCEEAILAIELPAGGSARRASVYVTSASVAVDRGGTLFLNEAPGGWEVSAAGCRPTAPELPLDCALED